ncbi:type IV toxin-antitoxin system AbiEi family antitoxin domain-containing protein, partial [candidate division WOR-3 bacterium]|nr:type IV toxin-antitoxin system AbiEi family antitoxin domain-containing protein [candidate division WOR-3 bacterium]
MKSVELLKKLKEMNKTFFTIEDLEKITGLSRKSLFVALNRWVKMGILERIGRGIYIPLGEDISVEKIASSLYLPNYLSFESALARYGILNVIPYSLTFVTTRKTKSYIIYGREVIFRKLKRNLFFGYQEKGGIYIALPEKALLDQIYMFTKGIASFDISEMDLSKISKKRLKGLIPPYPSNVREFVKGL